MDRATGAQSRRNTSRGTPTNLRMLWATVLMLWPDQVLTAISGHPPTPAGRRLLRVLAARHLLQAAISYLRPTPTVLRLGAVVDGLHAASCFGFAVLDPTWRRAAMLDGCAATVVGVATGASASHRARRR
jgi:hypothetical protein